MGGGGRGARGVLVAHDLIDSPEEMWQLFCTSYLMLGHCVTS